MLIFSNVLEAQVFTASIYEGYDGLPSVEILLLVLINILMLIYLVQHKC